MNGSEEGQRRKTSILDRKLNQKGSCVREARANACAVL